MCPLSNQLIPMPLNYDTDASSGNGVSVSESEVSAVSVVSEVARNKMLVWLKMCRKKRHKSPFISTKIIGKIQPPAFQYPYVLHPIIIIQNL